MKDLDFKGNDTIDNKVYQEKINEVTNGKNSY